MRHLIERTRKKQKENDRSIKLKHRANEFYVVFSTSRKEKKLRPSKKIQQCQ